MIKEYSRRKALGLMGGVMAGGAVAALAAPALATAAPATHQATEPEKGFSWTPRKLPDLNNVQLVARERFYHNGWG